MIPRATVVTNSKGGVGKTSIAANLAGLAASAGYRTLIIDLDPQGNLGRDLGYRDTSLDDNGAGLLRSLQFLDPIKPLVDVRPGLDVVCGGTYLEDVSKLELTFKNRKRDPRMILHEAVAPIASKYHLIIIDSPPIDRYLQMIGMCCAQYVLVPTRSDDASIDGLNGVATAFVEAREVNPRLELLGVVLFGTGASSTAIQREVREKIAGSLGDAAPVLLSQIRYLEAPARDARNRGLLAVEYDTSAVAGGPDEDGETRTRQRVAKTAGKLMSDYANLAKEFLTAVMSREQTASEEGS